MSAHLSREDPHQTDRHSYAIGIMEQKRSYERLTDSHIYPEAG